MPIIVNLAISGGVIWALLIIFNEGRSFKFVQQEAFLILGLVIVTGVVARLALPESLDLLVVAAQAVALFFGVDMPVMQSLALHHCHINLHASNSEGLTR